MRVSVVATGIDALDVNTDMPVPRRSMSRPLQMTALKRQRCTSSPVRA